MMAFQAGYSQKFSLGVAPQIANSTLPLIIQHFKQLQPDVIIQIDILPSNEIGEAVFRQQIDIGLSKVPSTRELLSTMIANEPVMIVGPKPFDAEDFQLLIKSFPIYTHAFSPYWEQIERHLPRDCQIERLNQTEVIKTFIKARRVFDNSKVESHSAIIPTYLILRERYNLLKGGKRWRKLNRRIQFHPL